MIGYDKGDPSYDHPPTLKAMAAALDKLLTGLPVEVQAIRYGGEDKGASPVRAVPPLRSPCSAPRALVRGGGPMGRICSAWGSR